MILISFPALISCLTPALKGCKRQLQALIALAAAPRSVLPPHPGGGRVGGWIPSYPADEEEGGLLDGWIH